MSDRQRSVGDRTASSSAAQTDNIAALRGGDCPSNSRFAYVPGKTLGRSGNVPDAIDALAMRIEYLDALLCVVTAGNGDADSPESFDNCNDEIQRTVLNLASQLAAEANELYAQWTMESLQEKEAKHD